LRSSFMFSLAFAAAAMSGVAGCTTSAPESTDQLSASDGRIGVISPADAHKLISDPDPARRPLVLDTRGGYKDYFRGHLPTAHHINFDTLRGTEKGVPVQYLPEHITRELLIRAGADKDRTIIVYATGEKLPNDEVLSSSMVEFVLEKYGFTDIRILDGGIPAWKAAGLPVTQEYPDTPPGDLPSQMNKEIGLNVEQVLELKDKPGHILVDARPANEYAGDDEIWLRKGHIPGAVSFHWAKLMAADNTHDFKTPEEARPMLEAVGITADKDIIVYCGTSREGSLLRFYLRHVMGYPKVRLYEGSWKEYAHLKQYPAETGAAGK